MKCLTTTHKLTEETQILLIWAQTASVKCSKVTCMHSSINNAIFLPQTTQAAEICTSGVKEVPFLWAKASSSLRSHPSCLHSCQWQHMRKAGTADEFAHIQIIGTDGIFFRSEGSLRDNWSPGTDNYYLFLMAIQYKQMGSFSNVPFKALLMRDTWL